MQLIHRKSRVIEKVYIVSYHIIYYTPTYSVNILCIYKYITIYHIIIYLIQLKLYNYSNWQNKSKWVKIKSKLEHGKFTFLLIYWHCYWNLTILWIIYILTTKLLSVSQILYVAFFNVVMKIKWSYSPI